MIRPEFDVRIGELVLDGVPAGDRHALVDALQAELRRLLTTEAAPFARTRGTVRIAAEADAAIVPPGSPQALGAAAAHAVFRQLSTLGKRP